MTFYILRFVWTVFLYQLQLGVHQPVQGYIICTVSATPRLLFNNYTYTKSGTNSIEPLPNHQSPRTKGVLCLLHVVTHTVTSDVVVQVQHYATT